MIRPLPRNAVALMGAALACTILAATGAAQVPGPSAPDTTAVSADSSHVSPRVVRTLPTTEVRALLGDLKSSQTTHLIPGSELHGFPVDGLAEVFALQPGVVAQSEELHVRGGRAGETMVTVDGMPLNEPQRYRAMEVPLLALESAELVSGALEAPLGGGIAGVMRLRTVHPTARPSLAWRWQGDGGLNTRFDDVSARASTPLGVAGLGVVAAADGRFDDTWLPMLRSQPRAEIAGLPFGWRAENRVLGSVQLAPVQHPERFSAEVFASRQVHEPYSLNWSLDGWTYIPPNLKMSPVFTPDPQPGSMRYRAADHFGITDERQMAAQLRLAGSRGAALGSVALSWLGSRSIFSLGGDRQPLSVSHRPKYGEANDRDLFYVLWGDYPQYRESASDVITLRGDGEWTSRSGVRWQAGAGVRQDAVALDQVDWLALGRFGVDPAAPPPADSIRSYRARAPGGFSYVTARWQSGGLILNTGLRAEYFTAGTPGAWQTLPVPAGGVWSFAPRLSAAYPISVRDVFSFSYLRIQQPPGRDVLYDNRNVTTNREPLGNPDLSPATAISYEAAIKHLFAPDWALQSSVFYRDVFNQVGVEDFSSPAGPMDIRYVAVDESSALGFEWALLHDVSGKLRLEGDYTWMQSWGNESRPGGDPYGPVRIANMPATGDEPLSWDRKHSFLLSALVIPSPFWSLAWTTAISSPFPWTPKPTRQPFTDIGLINSERLGWTENTNVSLGWSPSLAHGLHFGLEVRNLFDFRGDRAATLDGYPNPVSNTLYDDYGAYRTETGQGGGAYWSTLPSGDPGHWVAVHDPRLSRPPRAVRASVSAIW